MNLQTEMDALDPALAPRARIFQRASNPDPGRLGILDASYNPPTRAHEVLVDRAREDLQLSEVLLLISHANVDKEITGAALGQRLEMLLRWSADSAHLSVGGCSHARFIDKATALSPHYPSGTEFTFILGFDTLERLFDGRYYEDMEAELKPFFQNCRVAVANRGARTSSDVRAWLKQPACGPFAHRIDAFSVASEIAAMSSTEVRHRCAQGDPIADLVPNGIETYIHENRLYRTGKGA